MASSARALIPRAPGWVAAIFVAVPILVPVVMVFIHAGGAGSPSAADWAAVRFTVLQALISAVMSVALAVPIARALARRRFWGRGALITLMGAPFILPTIVAILGILAVFGRGGLLNSALVALGFQPLVIYGLHGVILAHVFFNLPLAVRIVLQGWLAIPAERFRLAATLGLTPMARFWVLEMPMLRTVVPGAFALVFALCLSSFAVALTLGGGPGATTVEVAIYHAFRFDFDLGRAAVLATVQLGLIGLAAALALVLGRGDAMGAGLDRVQSMWTPYSALSRGMDGLWVATGALLLVVPLAMVVARGVPGLGLLPDSVWRALLTSIWMAGFTVALTMALALALGLWAVSRPMVEGIAILGIAASPLVIGTGLFLVIYPFANPARFALGVTILVNALGALPFALRIILPQLRAIAAAYSPLSMALGMSSWAFLRLVVLPRLRRPLGFAAGLVAALAMGDLGVITLFAGQDQATLPLEILRLMGAYKMQAAASAGLLLLLTSLGLFWIFDRGGRANVDL